MLTAETSGRLSGAFFYRPKNENQACGPCVSEYHVFSTLFFSDWPFGQVRPCLQLKLQADCPVGHDIVSFEMLSGDRLRRTY